MKLIVALFLSLAYIVVNGQESVRKLEISAGSKKVFPGDKVPITVKINDPGLIDSFKFGKNILIESWKPFQKNEYFFYYTFDIVLNDTGIVKLGPIEIEYQNERLHSNEISIQVIEKKDKDYAMFVVPSALKCFSEEDIKLRSSTIDLDKVDLKDTKYFRVIGRSYSTSIEINNGITYKEYVSTFRVNFIAPGEMELNRDNLINLPPSLIIDPITIKIEE